MLESFQNSLQTRICDQKHLKITFKTGIAIFFKVHFTAVIKDL